MATIFNENKVILAGRLAADPELKQTSTGAMVATVTIAVNRPYQKGVESKADFFDLIAWKSKGEVLAKYFQKGSPIYIIGKIQNRGWTAQDGSKRTKTEVIVEEIKFIESKPKSENIEDGLAYGTGSQGFRQMKNYRFKFYAKNH